MFSLQQASRWSVILSFLKIKFWQPQMTFAKSLMKNKRSVLEDIFKVLIKFYILTFDLWIFFAFYTKLRFLYLFLSLRYFSAVDILKWVSLCFILLWIFFLFSFFFLFFFFKLKFDDFPYLICCSERLFKLFHMRK